MIIFNLDGTIADYEHRRHLLNPESYPDLCEYSNYRIVDGQPVIDLDGKASWRYKNSGEPFQKGFKSFYEACDKDEYIKEVCQIFDDLAVYSEIEIWSGRCESVRDKTVRWLYENSFYSGQKLKMRPIGDNTPDEILKERWLDETYEDTKWGPKTNISFVFDDGPKVVRMWRRRGIFVFNCCQHDKEF